MNSNQIKVYAPASIANLGPGFDVFGKAILERESIDLIEESPRLAAIKAEGANPFYKLWLEGKEELESVNADTIASAIKIGNPVSWRKGRKAIESTRGVVEQVSEQEIMYAKGIVDRCGIGCEPASAASVAGVKKLVERGVIGLDEEVVCILTGHFLKDVDISIKYHRGETIDLKAKYANSPIVFEGGTSELKRIGDYTDTLGSDIQLFGNSAYMISFNSCKN